MVKRPDRALYHAIMAVTTPNAPPATWVVKLLLNLAAANKMKVMKRQKNMLTRPTLER